MCERFWGKQKDWISSVENQPAEVEWKALAKAADRNLERLGQARTQKSLVLLTRQDLDCLTHSSDGEQWGELKECVTNLCLMCCALSVNGQHPSIYSQRMYTWSLTAHPHHIQRYCSSCGKNKVKVMSFFTDSWKDAGINSAYHAAEVWGHLILEYHR